MEPTQGGSRRSERAGSQQPAAQGRVTIELEYAGFVNHAAERNHIPVVSRVTLINEGPSSLAHLTLVVSGPSLASTAVHIERLDPGVPHQIAPLDVRFHAQYLAQLAEATDGELVCQVCTDDGQELARQVFPLEQKAYDQWPGLGAWPGLLAAFSLPNHPVVDRLLGQAAVLLAAAESGVVLDGYAAGSREAVWSQVAAIYAAIVAQGVLYSLPPASFLDEGQKIRTPDRILEGGVATCLDLTMLFVACLEQAGLNPLVLVKEGHAWVGVWLTEATLPALSLDDGHAIGKRVATGELLALESTAAGARPAPSFATAVEVGTSHLTDPAELAKFLVALDIRVARQSGVVPLATRWEGGVPLEEAPAGAPAVPGLDPPPAFPPLDSGELLTLPRPLTPAEQRVALWKAKLLDLTLRNRLINFRVNRFTIPLYVPDPGQVEDGLASGRQWRVRSLDEVLTGPDPRSLALTLMQTGKLQDALAHFDSAAHRELLSLLSPEVTAARLLEMFRAARTGLEEGGANTLYITIGMLHWSLPGEPTLAAAPIVLVPVSIARQRVASQFALTRHDDETVVNPTLLLLLQERFGLSVPGLDPLPTDGQGIDVDRVLQAFRLAVRDREGWEVQAAVHLTILSFAKHLMWRDLNDRADRLYASRVVARILGEGADELGAAGLDRRDDLDARVHPSSLLLPLDADSAQQNVLSRAAEGYDLVIQGPPGTGKSQTIANLIAHTLGEGKTVLFVSEKTAALEVVQRRLDAIGLSPFCLELHSAHANKRQVLDQLQAAFDAAGPAEDPGFERDARALAQVRDQLAAWHAVLHRRRSSGFSLYDALEAVVAETGRGGPDLLPVAVGDPDALDAEALAALGELVEQVGVRAADVRPRPGHPLGDLAASEFSSAWQTELSTALAQLKEATGEVRGAVAALADAGLPLPAAPSVGLYAKLAGSLELVAAAPPLPGDGHRQLVASSGDALRQAAQHGAEAVRLWQQLEPFFRPSLKDVDASQLAARWDAARSRGALGRWREERAVRRALGAHAHIPGGETAPIVRDVLATLGQYQEEVRALERLGSLLAELLGPLPDLLHVNWEQVAAVEAWRSKFVQHRDALTQEGGGAAAEVLRRWVTEEGCFGAEQLQAAGRFQQAYLRWQAVDAHVRQLAGQGELDAAHEAWADREDLPDRWLTAERQWRLWCAWRAVRDAAVSQGLAAAVQAVESGAVAPEELAAHWWRSYQRAWLGAVMDQEPLVRTFSRTDQMRRVERLKKLDAAFQVTTARWVRSTLSARIPNPAGTSRDPEMRLVLRELAKQRQHLPVRVLLRRLPTLLPRLKPCLLMSPLSVAQYLDADAEFDLVIFDEASQIPVWDAVGVISRGRQAIVVGDPRQLPPTTFFMAQPNRDSAWDEGEDESVREDDVESILDECMTVGVPMLPLRWHYRSRHESLIQFSNQRYYGRTLVTLPSPVTEDRAVRLVPVVGRYDRGHTRTNPAEARAIVEAIAAHFRDPERRRWSVGVVTFNQPQQHLIETLLEERERQDPALEAAMAEAGLEPVFVKNLENVQGDERDVIYFSVTYGRDQAGRMAMNFGPLNLAGGPRRLNVAVTRARREVVVFSTIGAEDIDLARTRAEGVRDLKEYLEYAARRDAARAGGSAAAEPGRSTLAGGLQRALAARGWDVHQAVGGSDFRVDLAVVDRRDASRYALAVITDGPAYRDLPSVRDRDLLAPRVLESLGWKVHRTWGVDWWESPDDELARIERALVQAGQERPGRPRASAADREDQGAAN